MSEEYDRSIPLQAWTTPHPSGRVAVRWCYPGCPPWGAEWTRQPDLDRVLEESESGMNAEAEDMAKAEVRKRWLEAAGDVTERNMIRHLLWQALARPMWGVEEIPLALACELYGPEFQAIVDCCRCVAQNGTEAWKELFAAWQGPA